MDARQVEQAQQLVSGFLGELASQFQKIPGSGILLRYVRSNYQNDPVRSAVELFLFLFFIRYLLAPKYSTQKQNYVSLSEEVCLAYALLLLLRLRGGFWLFPSLVLIHVGD